MPTCIIVFLQSFISHQFQNGPTASINSTLVLFCSQFIRWGLHSLYISQYPLHHKHLTPNSDKHKLKKKKKKAVSGSMEIGSHTENSGQALTFSLDALFSGRLSLYSGPRLLQVHISLQPNNLSKKKEIFFPIIPTKLQD